MFGLSFGEIAVILVVAVLVLGPEDLPKVIRTLSRAWRSFQLGMRDLRQQFDEAMGQEELEELKRLREALKGKQRILIDDKGQAHQTYDISDIVQARVVTEHSEAETKDGKPGAPS